MFQPRVFVPGKTLQTILLFVWKPVVVVAPFFLKGVPIRETAALLENIRLEMLARDKHFFSHCPSGGIWTLDLRIIIQMFYHYTTRAKPIADLSWDNCEGQTL